MFLSEKKCEIKDMLQPQGWRMGIAINPLLYTYSDWNKRHFTPFFQNVLKDGIELWH